MKYLEKFGGIIVFFTVILCIKVAVFLLGATLDNSDLLFVIAVSFMSGIFYYIIKYGPK